MRSSWVLRVRPGSVRAGSSRNWNDCRTGRRTDCSAGRNPRNFIKRSGSRLLAARNVIETTYNGHSDARLAALIPANPLTIAPLRSQCRFESRPKADANVAPRIAIANRKKARSARNPDKGYRGASPDAWSRRSRPANEPMRHRKVDTYDYTELSPCPMLGPVRNWCFVAVKTPTSSPNAIPRTKALLIERRIDEPQHLCSLLDCSLVAEFVSPLAGSVAAPGQASYHCADHDREGRLKSISPSSSDSVRNAIFTSGPVSNNRTKAD